MSMLLRYAHLLNNIPRVTPCPPPPRGYEELKAFKKERGGKVFYEVYSRCWKCKSKLIGTFKSKEDIPDEMACPCNIMKSVSKKDI